MATLIEKLKAPVQINGPTGHFRWIISATQLALLLLVVGWLVRRLQQGSDASPWPSVVVLVGVSLLVALHVYVLIFWFRHRSLLHDPRHPKQVMLDG